MSNYAIGDLQGCYEELQQLLTQIDFDKKKDVLWFCGDLVNRGSNSLNCLLYLHSIKDNCRIVLGNHDLHLIAVSDSIREINEKDTFQDVLESPKRKILIELIHLTLTSNSFGFFLFGIKLLLGLASNSSSFEEKFSAFRKFLFS